MAKVKALSQLVPFSSIAWFKEWNLGRPTKEYGDLSEKSDLFKSFVEHDWMHTGDATIEVEKIPDDYRERAIAERLEQWENLKTLAAADHTKVVDKEVFEFLFTTNGKLNPVEYIGDTGNRRSTVYFRAMVARRQADKPIRGEVPVIIQDLSGTNASLERLGIQIQENDLKNFGFQETSDRDKLYQAKLAFEKGANQVWMRGKFKDSVGQKLWAIVNLNAKFPQLKLYDRMMLPDDNPNYLPIKPVRPADAIALLNRSDPESLKQKNDQLRRSGRDPVHLANEEEVAKFFGKKEGVNLPKIMSRDTIENLSKNCPVRPLRRAFQAVMKNDSDVMNPDYAASAGLNAIDDLIQSGDYPPLEFVLATLAANNGQRGELIKELVSVAEKYAPKSE